MRRSLVAGVLAGVLLIPLVQSTTVPPSRVWVIAPFAIRIPGHIEAKPGPQRGVTYLHGRTGEVRTYTSGKIPATGETRVLRSSPFQD